MAQTTVLAATTSAGNSSDITVAAGSWIKISMYMTGGNVQQAKNSDGSYERLTMPIYEKDPNGVYVQVMTTSPSGKRTQLYLTRMKPQEVIVGPGTYRVSKSATTNSVGVYTES